MQTIKTQKLSDLIELSPGFKAAVSLNEHLNDHVKTSNYIPTQKAMEVLYDFSKRLHPTSGKRAKLITGTYGTGKSHLALVLLALYRFNPRHNSLAPIFKKISGYPGQKQEIIDSKEKIDRPFLEVLLYGDEGNFNSVLLKALDRRLRSDEKLKHLLPPTRFQGAVKRIEEMRTRFPGSWQALKNMVVEGGYVSMEAFITNLLNYEERTFNAFLEYHINSCGGAHFDDKHLQEPREVYKEVCKKLVEDFGYSGIVVVWDEFGRYMERMVQDPKSDESEMIQKFAEYCNNSNYNQTHLYLICHRSFKQYVDLGKSIKGEELSNAQREELDKISGRFVEFQLKTEDEEIFNLIDKVIVQEKNNGRWMDFENRYREYFDKITDKTKELKIFPTFSRSDIYKIITKGCYPLHPLTSFCLPRVSEFVAQNERTIFSFLSSDGQKTLGSYLEKVSMPEVGESPPFFTMDMLWDFFETELERDPRTKSIVRKFHSLNATLSPDDILAKRILKMIAVHQSIETDRFVPTRDVIFFALNLSEDQRSKFEHKMDELSSGDSRILIKNHASNSYRFFASSANLMTALDKMIKKRFSKIKPFNQLEKILESTAFTITEIKSTGYNDDFQIERCLNPVFCSVDNAETARLNIVRNLSQGSFKDGYFITIIHEDTQQKNLALEYVNTKFNHPQVLAAIPTQSIRWQQEIRKLDALDTLEKEQPAIYGKGGEARDEWEEIRKDQLDVINNLFKPVFDVKQKKLEWYYKGELQNRIVSDSKVRRLASSMMEDVFPDTPVIYNDKLTSDSGSDTYAKYRKDVIAKALKSNAAMLLTGETNSTLKHVIDSVYKNNGILYRDKKTKKWKIGKPDNNENPSMCKVWKLAKNFLKNSKDPRDAKKLIDRLKSPPFGLRERSLSLILAVVWRDYILKGNVSFIYRDRSIINNIDNNNIEGLVMAPSNYKIKYTEIGALEEMILKGISRAFDINIYGMDGVEKIEAVKNGLSTWWMGLSKCARETNFLEAKSNVSVFLRELIFRKITQSDTDARDILFKDLINKFGMNDPGKNFNEDAIYKLFIHVREDFEYVKERFRYKILEIFKEVFPKAVEDSNDSARYRVGYWYKNLPEATKKAYLHGSSGILLTECRNFKGTGDEEIISLAIKLKENLSVGDWIDSTLNEFKGILQVTKKGVEDYRPPVIIKPPEPSGGNGVNPTPPPPPKDFVSVTINDVDGQISRNFKRIEELSTMGNTLQNILKSTIDGMKGALQNGEYETILVDIIKEHLK